MRSRILHCDICGFRAVTFPVKWDEGQQRNHCWCPKCGEDERVQVLFNGYGAFLTTIPSDAMDQLMKQLPIGWFFPRKKASEVGWHNKVAKKRTDEDVEKFKRTLQDTERGIKGLKHISRNIMKHLGFGKDQETD